MVAGEEKRVKQGGVGGGAVGTHELGEKVGLSMRRGEGGEDKDVKELTVVVLLEAAKAQQ